MAETFDPKKHQPDPKLLKQYQQELDNAIKGMEALGTGTGKVSDNTKDTLKYTTDISRIYGNLLALSAKELDTQTAGADKTARRASMLRVVQQHLTKIGASEEMINEVQQKIIKGEIVSHQQLDKKLKAEEHVHKKKIDQNMVDSVSEKIQKAKIKRTKEYQDLAGDIITLNKEQVKGGEVNHIQQIIGMEKEKAQILLDQNQARMEKVHLGQQNGDLTQKQADDLNSMLLIEREQIENFKTLNSTSKEFKQVLVEADGQFGQLQASVTGVFEQFPGGDYLMKKLGLGKLQQNLSNAFVGGLGTFSEKLEDGASMTEALSAGWADFGGLLSKSMTSVALIAAAIGGLFALLMSNNKQAKELADNMGVSKNQAKALMKNAAGAAGSMQYMYATMDDILEVQQAMSEEMGNGLILTADQAAATADIGIAFGYGADEAAKVNAQLMRMGKSVEEANKIQTFTAALADASGVPVGKVMKDVAENGKKASKYMKGNAKELAKAAVEAAKMGTSLEGLVSMADSLLDFEQQLEDTAMANAMTGKMMNFDLARRLALEGNLVGMGREILNQVGSLADFQNMNVAQKEAMAKAAGMEVDELENTLALQEKMKNMTDDQIAAASKLGLTASELKDMSQEEIMNRVAQADAAEKLQKNITNIKNELKQALLPLAEALGNAFNMILPVVKLIGAAIQGFLWPFTKIFEFVNGIVKGIKNFLADMGILEPILKGMKGLFKAIGVILAVSIMPKVYSWVTSMASMAWKQMPSLLKGFGKIAWQVATKILPNIIMWSLKFTWMAIKGVWSLVKGMAKIGVSLVTKIIPNILIWAGKMLIMAIKNLPSLIKGFAKMAWHLVTKIIPQVLIWATQMAIMALQNLPGLISGFAKVGMSLLTKIIPSILTWAGQMTIMAATTIWSLVKGFAKVGWHLATKILPQVLTWVSQMAVMAAKTIWELVKGFAKVAWHLITEIIPQVLIWTAKMLLQATATIPAIISGLGTMIGKLGKVVFQVGKMVVKFLMGAVGAIYQAFGAMGIVGIALAAGAVALMYSKVNQAKAQETGDLGIDPNGGPVVASPQEGTLFQGSSNDGVSMSPDHGTSGGGGGGTVDSSKLTPADIQNQTNTLTEILNQILAGVNNPPPVVVGDTQATDIGNIASAGKSFLGI